MKEEDFLNIVWQLDHDNVDFLAMSDGDVMVSLNSGTALAMTPLLTAIRDALADESTSMEVITRLMDRFPADDVCNALYVLCDARFLAKAAANNRNT
jgi:hypothetical protein